MSRIGARVEPASQQVVTARPDRAAGEQHTGTDASAAAWRAVNALVGVL
jgi:hypothetical protein